MAINETAQVRWTTADLEHVPNDNGTRYEIIAGELHMSKQPHWEHQNVCTNLTTDLSNWNRKSGLGKVIAAPGIIFSTEDAVAPDLIWVSNDRLKTILGEDGKLHAAPELAIEVLSYGGANEQRDKEFKLKLYSVRGVSEYWIVDWRLQTVEIYRRESAALQLIATLRRGDVLTSPLLPHFQLKVSEIFA